MTDSGNWYDHARYYDIFFGWDPAQERDFVLGASRRWGRGDPRRILEPMCGPGRMLRSLPGRAIGFDLNEAMVRYAARDCAAFRADAAAFAVRPESFDLAFCLIDSFRHLQNEDQACSHLRSVASALRPGGLYVLGFDVTGGLSPDTSREEWKMSRDGVRISGWVQCLGDADPRTRLETMHVCLDVRDGRTRTRVEDFQPLRIYSVENVEDLLRTAGGFDLVACYDRRYDLDRPRSLDSIQGSAVLLLRKRKA